MSRKIEKMHEVFGREWGKKCKDCRHLSGNANQYRKCEIYGNTRSDATDWALSYEACGLWNKEYKGDIPIIDLGKERRRTDLQVPGQMSFLEV